MQLNPKQSARLVELLRQAKISTDGLKPQSPYGFDTPRAKQICAVVEALDPAFAAELAGDQEPSLEYLALQHRAKTEDIRLESLSEALRAEVMLRDGEAIRAQQQAQEEALMQKWDQEAKQLAKAAGRDPDAPRRPANWQEAQMMQFAEMDRLEKQAMAQVAR